MDPLLRKMNLKDERDIVVLGAPADLRPLLTRFSGDARVRTRMARGTAFVIAFVRTAADIERRAAQVASGTEGDAKVWMAHPKTSSPLHRPEVSRDQSWEPMGAAGFEPVRQVAIDDDWSALRFRRVEHIATLTRDPSRALSREGRRRATGSPRAG